MKPTPGPYECKAVSTDELGQTHYCAIIAPTPPGLSARRHGYVIADTLNCDFCIEHPGEEEANAEFICRACNNYDEMLSALKEASKCIMGMISLSQADFESPPEPSTELDAAAGTVVAHINRVIRVAEGGAE